MIASIIEKAIAASKENRKRFMGHYDMGNATGFAIKFCTVAINIGRGTGKTKYIMDNAKPWDLVIVNNFSEVQRLKRLGDMLPHQLPISIEEYVRSNCWRGRQQSTPRNIYIDEASSISHRLLDELYLTVPKHPDQTFILLG